MSRHVNFRLSRAVLTDLPLREQHGSRLRPLSQQGKPLTYSSCTRARDGPRNLTVVCIGLRGGLCGELRKGRAYFEANARIAHLPRVLSFSFFFFLLLCRLQLLGF